MDRQKLNIFQDWRANRGNAKGRIVLLFFRLANLISAIPKPLVILGYPYVIFYKILFEWILCVELPWKLKIGPRLRIYHGQSLVVHDKTIIGSDCVLRHSTTLGVSNTSADYVGAAPIIGNNVDIGANVVIIGNISIGDGCVIGAGSVVIRSVPKMSVVVGNPGRVINSKL